MSDLQVMLRIKADGSAAATVLRNTEGALKGVADAGRKAGEGARQAGDGAEQSARKAEQSGRAWSTFGKLIATAFTGATVIQIARIADMTAGLDARLKIVSRSTEEYAAANGLVLQISQETRQSLQSTGALFVKLTNALKDTGASQLEVANLTRTINQAFAVSGSSAGEAAAAITQLAQGLAAGALRGDEFNSVAEQAPRIMDALAKSLGVTRGELRAMAEDGKLTGDFVRTALREAASDIGAEFAQLPVTIGGGLTQIQNAVQSLIGWFNAQSGGGNAIGRFFGEVAEFIQALPAVAVGVISQFEIWWEQLKALFKLGGIALRAAIMEPINVIIRGLQLSLIQIGQAAAQLPGGLGDQLALSMGRAVGALNSYVFTSQEFREEVGAAIAARDAAVDSIERNVAAWQEDYREQQRAIASSTEYENRTRAVNGERTKAVDLAKQSAQAERALYSQRLPLLEQFGEELRARRDLLVMLEEMDERLDSEIRLAGLSTKQRQLAVNAMKAEEFAREVLLQSQRAGTELTAQEIDLIRQSVEARLNLADATAEATAAQEEANRELANFAGSYLGQAADAIGDFVARGMRGWRDLWQSFKDIGRRALADFISNLIRQRIVVPIIAQITGQGGGGGGLGLAGSAAGLLGGLGGLGTGLTASAGIFGSAGLVGGFGASVSAGLSSIAGGAIAQGIGLLAGPIGLALTAVNLLTSLFRSNKPPDIRIGGSNANVRNVEETFNTSPFGALRIGTRGGIQRDDTAQAVTQFDNAIAQIVQSVGGGQQQLDAIRQALSTWSVDLRSNAATVENVLGSRFQAILGTFSQSVQDFVRGGATLEEQIQRLGEALQFPREIQAVIDGFAREDLLANMTELERRTFEVNERFDAAIEYLRQRSATEEQLAQVEAFRARALAALTEATEDSVGSLVRDAARIGDILDRLRFEESLVGLSDLDRELALLAREAANAAREASELGATEAELAEIREIYAARAARIQAEAARIEADAAARAAQEAANYWAQVQEENARAAQQAADAIRSAFGGLADFLRGELFSETSTLTPAEQFAAAQAQFQDILARAAAGDQNAAQGIAGAAQQLLQQGLSFLGGGDPYRQLREAVLGALGPLAAIGQSGSQDAGLLQGGPAAALRRFLELMRGFGIGPSAIGVDRLNFGPAANGTLTVPQGLSLPGVGGGSGNALSVSPLVLDRSFAVQDQQLQRLTAVETELRELRRDFVRTGEGVREAIQRSGYGSRFG